MTADELRALQAPVKQRYKEEPQAARATLQVSGDLDLARVACRINVQRTEVLAGLHPYAGGDGSFACAAEMLLESVVGCAGTTLCAVATAMGLPITGGRITALGELDFRGTLGIDRTAPVGFTSLRLQFHLTGTASREQIDKLLQLTERYCVVLQTLKSPPSIVAEVV